MHMHAHTKRDTNAQNPRIHIHAYDHIFRMAYTNVRSGMHMLTHTHMDKHTTLQGTILKHKFAHNNDTITFHVQTLEHAQTYIPTYIRTYIHTRGYIYIYENWNLHTQKQI